MINTAEVVADAALEVGLEVESLIVDSIKDGSRVRPLRRYRDILPPNHPPFDNERYWNWIYFGIPGGAALLIALTLLRRSQDPMNGAPNGPTE